MTLAVCRRCLWRICPSATRITTQSTHFLHHCYPNCYLAVGICVPSRVPLGSCCVCVRLTCVPPSTPSTLMSPTVLLTSLWSNEMEVWILLSELLPWTGLCPIYEMEKSHTLLPQSWQGNCDSRELWHHWKMSTCRSSDRRSGQSERSKLSPDSLLSISLLVCDSLHSDKEEKYPVSNILNW